MKTIRDGQLLGELGVNLVQSVVLKMGFTWHPSNQAVEAGIDGWVELRDAATGAVKNSWLAVQSKARSKLTEDGTSIKFPCSAEDIEYWMQGSAPVILVVSKPHDAQAWWISVKDYFRTRDIQSERSIVFDIEKNRLTPESAEEWKGLASQYGAGTYFTPAKRQETLTSNLLNIARFEAKVYSANTPLASGKEVREKLKTIDQYPPWEWAFGNGKQLYSFHDLSTSPWKSVCDVSSIKEHDTESLAFSDDWQMRNAFTQLLDGCLRAQLRPWRMGYSKEEDCDYFLPSPLNVERDITYQSRSNRTSRDVVKKYLHQKDKTRIAYYRHNGMSHRFLRFGESWFLMIEPTYVFTIDGKHPDPYREEHLSKIKSFEGDAAISGSIFMFADLLKDRTTMFEEPYKFLGYGQLESCTMEVGIDDEAWARMKKTHDDLLTKAKTEAKNATTFGAGLFD
jgi:hypothetical protein